MGDIMKYGQEAIKNAVLETWANETPERDYSVEISFPEFTCLCPRSGYPDFATILVTYIPDLKVVELKSIKLYFNSYRDVGISHEGVINKIYTDLKEALQPRFIEVIGDFNPRGNLKTVIRVSSNDE